MLVCFVETYLVELDPYARRHRTAMLLAKAMLWQWLTCALRPADVLLSSTPLESLFLNIFLTFDWQHRGTSKYSAMCSQASSNWFSSNITSNISEGHWANFSAATICTDRFFACAFPRDLINRCKT